ncbi:MAG: glycoside hydrolase family 5 protein [Gemmatimonadetes bacterium]|nr:glycoside hydrolase family 5 protein [Gemmatimonadota bacterium]
MRNQLISAENCKPFRFVGIAYPSYAFSPTGDRLGDTATAAADFARIRSWGANTVGIQVAQYYWTPASRFYDAGYAARVERTVRQARAAGLRVILTLLHSDRGDPNYPGDPGATNMHQPMPDVNHSVPFWREAAERFKDDGGILFELFAEPYPVGASGYSNWALWLNGGTHPADRAYEPRAAFQAVGMQQLYDVVRATGAQNVVLVGGTTWGYHLDGVPAHRLRGHNIAYAAHPWDWPNKQPASWQKDWLFLAATDPVIISEFGGYDCGEPYTRAVLDKADQLGLSWNAWAWSAPEPSESTAQTGRGDPICEFPMLLTDWSGEPSRVGQIIKSRLGSY